jgi:ABC-type oligopeptide transport system substrate-binding subunit
VKTGRALCHRARASRRPGLFFRHWQLRLAFALALIVSLVCGGCFLDTEVEPFYGRVNVPRAQEFRWSDGGLPQTFDPALAAAPPDTDVVRAIFEGLTEYDPKTLTPVPGVAARWESSADGRQWTFYLRRDARWTNNDPVTARDFVRSWQRTLQLGERAPHANLLENIVGAGPVTVTATPQPAEEAQPIPTRRAEERKEERPETKKETRPTVPKPQPPAFGAEAIDDYVLRVRLQRPDINFPVLVAHPVFRPVHNADDTLSTPSPAGGGRIISNGAFQLSKAGGDGVVLERASSYWDAQTVSLQRVQFVSARDAEGVLEVYRAGDVDAVTNVPFEPLAVKLLAPYKDFRRATYGALTYYTFNTTRAPFNDVRVREALAISIDRERICEDEMGGATEPATRFLPTQTSTEERSAHATKPGALTEDRARARSLLREAGYPGGAGFPRIRLLVNRNDPQRLVAQSVAEMWRSQLGVETDVIVKNWDEYEADIRAGEYDVARRGLVMQTTDEETNMRIMFEPILPEQTDAPTTEKGTETAGEAAAANDQTNGAHPIDESSDEKKAEPGGAPPPPILSEAQALKEIPAIPIYFASSYALVKPYVVGFDANLLDAPSLKHVRINTTWQHPKQATLVWFPRNDE